MIEALRRVWVKVRQWLNTDSVIPFVWVFYLWLLAFGIIAIGWLQPSGAVERQLGHTTFNAWTIMCIVGTSSVMAGLILRHGSTPLEDMTGRQLFNDWLGLWMQWGGHAAMFLVLLIFELAGLSDPQQLSDPFVLFVIAPYVQGCALLWLITSMKLLKAARL